MIFRAYRSATIVAAIILLLDFCCKYIVHINIAMNYSYFEYPYGGIAIFKNWHGISCAIVHSTNKGAAWGLFSSYQTALILLRVILVFFILTYIYVYLRDKSLYVPVAIVLGGAIGNIIDYFIYGHVIDMIYFKFWGYSYPVFNIADIAISVGGVYLFCKWYSHKKRECL